MDISVTSQKVRGTYGGQVNEMIADFTHDGEMYEVKYRRFEPSGRVEVIEVKLPELTTENTLIPEVIEDHFINEIESY